MGEKKATVSKPVAISGMLFFGTCTVVIQKAIFSMRGRGMDQHMHYFKKPWAQTEAMFIGMMLCLVVFYLRVSITKCKIKKQRSDMEALLSHEKPSLQAHSENGEEGSGEAASRGWRPYVLVFAPALCDMVATCLMNVGLTVIAASVWQLLRGSMVVFSALISIVALKKKIWPYQWFGITLVVTALLAVGFSAILGPPPPGSDDGGGSANTVLQLFGMILTICAQVVQASQIVIEEFLLSDIKLDPDLIVGLEGFWGTIATSLALIPAALIPSNLGPEGMFGILHEDTADTLYMLTHNWYPPFITLTRYIALTGVIYVFAILGYNLFGMTVTQNFSAVLRTILEALRTVCIWLVNLVIHLRFPGFGEIWSIWSYLELLGCFLMIGGAQVYEGIIRLPGFFYPPKKPQPEEQGSLLQHEEEILKEEQILGLTE